MNLDQNVSDVSIEFLDPERKFPVVLQPEQTGLSALQWCQENKTQLENLITEYGAVLLRGWDIPDHNAFSALVDTITETPWTGLSQLFAIRTQVEGGVFTASDYEANERLYTHSEFSHNAMGNWPKRIYFYSALPAAEGGETPLSDLRAVYKKIPEKIKQEFLDKGMHYYRSLFHDERSWEDAFMTSDQAEVEKKLEAAKVNYRWSDDGKDLHLDWPLYSVAKDPDSGDMVWFNQAQNVNFDNFSDSMQKYYTDRWGEGARPMDCTFGNGERIPMEYVKKIVEIFDNETVAFPWQQGDALIVQNMIIAHGKNPHKGERKTLVSMSDPIHKDDVWTQ